MSLIDKVGRKFLLMSGAIGMSVFLFLIFLTLKFNWFSSYALLVCVLGYQAGISFGKQMSKIGLLILKF